jgi:hypothetical protein
MTSQPIKIGLCKVSEIEDCIFKKFQTMQKDKILKFYGSDFISLCQQIILRLCLQNYYNAWEIMMNRKFSKAENLQGLHGFVIPPLCVHFCLFVFVVIVLLLLFFKTGFHCLAQADLTLPIFLPLPPKCWDYRPHLACLFFSLFPRSFRRQRNSYLFFWKKNGFVFWNKK